MPTRWQTIRVFISSTFRDMHSERDWLIKRVFPALRERLEPYRVHLMDIDLRWGVTEEQAESGGALDVCLRQIDECRPFFLGLLGERYGWVPEKIPQRVIDEYAWIDETSKKSITEMEIFYAVLREEIRHPNCYFCFRDPKFLESVPEVFRRDLISQDEISAKKLRDLKQTIRDAELPNPPLENYPCRYAGVKINWRLAQRELSSSDQTALEEAVTDGFIPRQDETRLDEHLRRIVHRYGSVHLVGLQEFGDHVRNWLWEAIRARLDLPRQPHAFSEVSKNPLSEEEEHHQRFMENRLLVYVGRETLQEELSRFADGDDQVSCLVTGPSGSGKSAALAKFARHYAQSHPDVLVVPHFIGASPASTNLRLMLRRFCEILKGYGGISEEVPQDVQKLSLFLREFVHKVPDGRRVVFVLDALDQLDDSDQAHQLYWFPWNPPAHIKFIASCIEVEEMQQPVLRRFIPPQIKTIAIEPLNGEERRAILREVPLLSAKTLEDSQVEVLLANPATTNPLFLLVALEELRGFGSYEQLNRRIEAFPSHGDSVTAIFIQVIERLEDEFDPGITRDVLSLIASARRGLSHRELLDLIEGASVKITDNTSDLFSILRQLRPYLQTRGELLNFYHQNLFKAVREKYLPDEETQSVAHSCLAGYFRGQGYFLESVDEQRARAKRFPPTPRPANIRKVDELPYHLLEFAKLRGKGDPAAKEWDAVAELFTDLQFLEAKAEAQPEGQS